MGFREKVRDKDLFEQEDSLQDMKQLQWNLYSHWQQQRLFLVKLNNAGLQAMAQSNMARQREKKLKGAGGGLQE